MSSAEEKKVAERRNSRKKSFTRLQNDSAVTQDVKANAMPANRSHSKSEEKKEVKTKTDERKLLSPSSHSSIEDNMKYYFWDAFFRTVKLPEFNKTSIAIENDERHIQSEFGETATKLLSDRPSYIPSEGSELTTPPIDTSPEMGSDTTTLSPVKRLRRSTLKFHIFKKRKTIVQMHAAAKTEKSLGELAKEKNFTAAQMRRVSKVKNNKTNGQPIVKVPNELLEDRTVRNRVSFDTQLSMLGRSISNLLNGLIAEADLPLKTDGIRSAEQAKKDITNKQGTSINLTKRPATCTCATTAVAAPVNVNCQTKQGEKIIHSAGCPLGNEAEESEQSEGSEMQRSVKDCAEKDKANKGRSSFAEKKPIGSSLK
ncbi:hypothetical protein M514_07481 [Trichuris suis]|uniref:Uncharacterized protein n=1 Tax=Trichuris suis TaxID=68888 RepID=A0A085NE45_9BILA|nr:hypothetical protein M514_07481 [Trichuris suis]